MDFRKLVNATTEFYEAVKPRIGRVIGLTDTNDHPWLHWRATGFLISEDGLIATAHHVIGDGKDLGFVTGDGRQFLATVVADDEELDLSILRVQKQDSDKFDPMPLDRTGLVTPNSPCLGLGYPAPCEKLNTLTPGPYIRTEETKGHEWKISSLIGIRPRHIFQMQGIGGHSGGPILNDKGEVCAVIQVRYHFSEDEQIPGIAGSSSKDLLSLLHTIQ
jgi:S1-C subfamily serine protease